MRLYHSIIIKRDKKSFSVVIATPCTWEMCAFLWWRTFSRFALCTCAKRNPRNEHFSGHLLVTPAVHYVRHWCLPLIWLLLSRLKLRNSNSIQICAAENNANSISMEISPLFSYIPYVRCNNVAVLSGKLIIRHLVPFAAKADFNWNNIYRKCKVVAYLCAFTIYSVMLY